MYFIPLTQESAIKRLQQVCSTVSSAHGMHSISSQSCKDVTVSGKMSVPHIYL